MADLSNLQALSKTFKESLAHTLEHAYHLEESLEGLKLPEKHLKSLAKLFDENISSLELGLEMNEKAFSQVAFLAKGSKAKKKACPACKRAVCICQPVD